MKKLKLSLVLTVVFTFILFAIYQFDLSRALPLIPLVGLLGFSPFFSKLYFDYVKLQAMEDVFPEFLRNISESQKSGITISQAIITSTKIDYGVFSDEVKKMAAQISWGIPLPTVLKKFSKRVSKSDFLKRSVAIILEAYRSGGDVAEVMERVAESSRQIKELEAERKSKFNQQLLVMYAIYVIFIVIIVALNKILLPMFALSSQQDVGGVAIAMGNLDANFYRTIFQHMILIQAVFAGLIAGQVGEGSIVAGLKHSAIMLAMGSLAFFLFLPSQNVVINVEPSYDVYPPSSFYSLEGFVLDSDQTPISEADVTINIGENSYTATTDNFGMFTKDIMLPSTTGLYTIKISADTSKGKGSKEVEVSVG